MSVRDYLSNRGVNRLCHFTKIGSLTHILSDQRGILASSYLNDKSFLNDELRLDNNKDYVCCSIQYPNWWYYNNVEKNNHNDVFNNWAVLFIDLSVLDIKDCKYCACNAAKRYGYYIFDDEKRIDELYAQTSISGQTRWSTMLSCCPTDDQAEIQIKNNIPISLITGIAVGNDTSAQIVFSILKTYNISIPIIMCPEIFCVKCSKTIRQGQYPTESIVEY